MEQKILDNLLHELKRGTLVFSVLLNVKEAAYGYSLVEKLKEAGVDIDQFTLYPLLRRLEKQGLLESLWDTSESRPRKYYKISEDGEYVLEKLIIEWQNKNRVLNSMIERRNSDEVN